MVAQKGADDRLGNVLFRSGCVGLPDAAEAKLPGSSCQSHAHLQAIAIRSLLQESKLEAIGFNAGV